MPALFEDLGRHVTRSAAGSSQNVELFFVHDAAETEVGDKKVGIVFGRTEEQVLGLEVAVYYAVVVQVCDS